MSLSITMLVNLQYSTLKTILSYADSIEMCSHKKV